MSETDTRPIIQIRKLVKTYGYLPVLKQLDLDIARGQFVALLGANGSGKSTLLRLISGLLKPTAGSIAVGGWQMPHEAAQVRAQIGMVSHKPLLYDNLTARENLQFYARIYNINAAETQQRINDLLERVGLKKRADTLVRTYSRGMQQRLSIARALLPEPHVLLFDEPHTGLDQAASATLDILLREAHQAGHTIVMTTHELERAAKLAERAIILQRGGIVYDDRPTTDLPALFAQLTGTTAAP
jgi:heme exporter protein A